MKTPEKPIVSLDEIVFSNRNKDYGAYALRTRYPKYLSRALSVAVMILLISVSIPLIASYYNKVKGSGNEVMVTATFDDISQPPDDVKPPPPPPLSEPMQRSFVFTVPQVVDSSRDNYSFDQEELSRNQVNRIIDTMDKSGNDTPPPPPPVIDLPHNTEPFTIVEEMPTYAGGEEARIKFLQDNLVYPAIARETGITGTVYIDFVVDEEGNSTHLQIKKGIGGGCDEEAMRVLKMMHWNPGRQRGKAVPVKFNVPVKFLLRSQ